MTTSAQVAAYEHEARAIPGLPDNIVYLPDNPLVLSGLQAKMGDGNAPYLDPATGYIEGAPNYTVTRRIALHELGHLRDFNNRGQRDAFWTARFGACTTAPKTWAEAYADAHTGGTEIWMVLPGETVAECFAVAVEGTGKERTLDYGCTVDPAAMRAFFGYAAPAAQTIDVRGQLPFVGNVFGLFEPKDSLTFHWNGGPVPEDSDPMAVLIGDANHHIAQGWGGISYHGAIWRDGTLYITRDASAILAACGNAVGNQRSRHVQVMIGLGQSPTVAQWWRMNELAKGEASVHPHGPFWSATQCPGDEIRAWIAAGGEEEDDMFTDADRQKLDKIYARMEVEEARIWTQRLQDWLSKVFKSFPSYARPSDYSGPDVTSGQPRT